jgi:hypothetical protein
VALPLSALTGILKPEMATTVFIPTSEPHLTRGEFGVTCRGTHLFDFATNSCPVKLSIPISIGYPQTLMDSSPFIKQRSEEFVRNQQADFLNNFLAYPNDKGSFLNSSLTITSHSYKYSASVTSLVFNIEANSGGAHPQTQFETFTFDLNDQAVIHIKDLFRNGVDPVGVLAPLVSQSFTQQFGNNSVHDLDPQIQAKNRAKPLLLMIMSSLLWIPLPCICSFHANG